jgi:TrfB plasmid transcriptional repressor
MPVRTTSKLARSMSAAEFNDAFATLTMRERARDIARAVLVHGKSFEEVFETLGASRQTVLICTRRVYDAFRPPGWVTERLTLPPDSMAQVRLMEREERARLKAKEEKRRSHASRRSAVRHPG